MRCLLAAAVWLGLTSAASGQRLYFGVIGGMNVTANFPLTDYTTSADSFGNPASHFQFRDGARSLILGLSVEARFSESFFIEANVLRRSMNSTIIFTEFPVGTASITTTNHHTEVDAWEFPLLLKYTLSSWRPARPFLAAGPAFRAQENAGATELSQVGVSAGAGVSVDLGRIRIAPQLRYTRWTENSIYPKYATKPDQLEFLTIIAYRTAGDSRRVAGRKLELGAIAGLPVTRGFQPIDGDTVVERTRYLAGLTTVVSVAHNFWIEADGIYKPLRAGSDSLTRFSVLTWQFPLLAKYSLAKRTFTWRTFAEGGASFRLAGNLNGYNPSHYGVTVGGGIETYVRGVRLSPTLRYTRWAKDASPFRIPVRLCAHERQRSRIGFCRFVLADCGRDRRGHRSHYVEFAPGKVEWDRPLGTATVSVEPANRQAPLSGAARKQGGRAERFQDAS